ncbi:MAG TPA: hypothetical protein VI758_00210 [Bacteroidota bacterium]
MKALAFLILIPFVILRAGENNGRGTKAIATANAFVAVADNPWAVSYNAAGLIQIRSPEFSAFYIPQQFGLPELKTTSLAAAFPIFGGSTGIIVEQFGFELYRTIDFELGYGIALNKRFSVGATFNLERESIKGYGASSNITVDVGLLGKPFDNLAIGFAMNNLTAARAGRGRERLPQVVHFGVRYTPFADFFLSSELEKDVDFPLVFKAGIEERFFDFLDMRFGASNNPDKICAGFAVHYGMFEFGYAGYSHTDLGWTHQIELSIRWNDRE